MRSSGLRLLLLALVVPVIGMFLMVLAMLVPDRLVLDELHDAIVSGSLTEDNYGHGLSGSRVDSFSECKRLTIGLGAVAGDGVIDSAVRNPTLGPCDTAVPKIEAWAQGEGLSRAYTYFRYWNGSAAVLRPSVALLGLAGTRILAAMALALAIIAFWFRLSWWVGRVAASLGVFPIVATTDFVDLPSALVHALGMLAALLSAWLLLRWLRADSANAAFAGATFVAGAAFLFVGDLTNPDAAWALAASSSAVVVAALPLRLSATRVAFATGGWITGFAWMWIAKWLIAIPVVGYNTVRYVVTTQAETRLSGEIEGDSGSLFSSAARAFDSWSAQPLMIPVAVVCGLTAVVVAIRRSDLAATWPHRVLIAVPAIIPVVWHGVMRQHTYIHAWFTYRSFAVGLGIVLMALTARIDVGADRGTSHSNTRSTNGGFVSSAAGPGTTAACDVRSVAEG